MTDDAPVRRRVLVTGVNGFVGHHLVTELVRHGHEVVGIGRDAEPRNGLVLADYVQADLTQAWPDIAAVDAVVHLAGLSAVGPSFADPQQYLDVNGSIANHLAFWVTRTDKNARVVVVSSGAVYDSSRGTALAEDSEIAFTSPYVVSKILVENLALFYRSRGIDVIIARPFNHIGPGQGPGFILPDLYRLIREADNETRVLTGNLKTTRDYTDVRDVVSAYRLLVEASALKHVIYNICSGVSLSGEHLLRELETIMGLPRIDYHVDPDRVRPNEPPQIVGSSERLREELGWVPTREVGEAVADFVSDREGWRGTFQ